MMYYIFYCLWMSIFLFVGFFQTLQAQQTLFRTDFSGDSISENNVTILGPGFGALPEADISFGSVPSNNGYDGATDGHGVIITAEPGEGIMLFTRTMNTPTAAIIRCNVRMSSIFGAITLGAIGKSGSADVPTNAPSGFPEFNNKWHRVSIVYAPPSAGFDPFIQLFNPEDSGETVMFYLDNFDVHLIQSGKYYSGEFLDGDGDDPSSISIVPGDGEPSDSIPPLDVDIPAGGLVFYDSTGDDGIFKYNDNANLIGVLRPPITDEDILQLVNIQIDIEEGSFGSSTAQSEMSLTISINPSVSISTWPGDEMQGDLESGEIIIAVPESLNVSYSEVDTHFWDRLSRTTLEVNANTPEAVKEAQELIFDKLLSLTDITGIPIIFDLINLTNIITDLSHLDRENPANLTALTSPNTHDNIQTAWDKVDLFSSAGSNTEVGWVRVDIPLLDTPQEALGKIQASQHGIAVFLSSKINVWQPNRSISRQTRTSNAIFVKNGIKLNAEGIPDTPSNSGDTITVPLPNLPSGAKPLDMVWIEPGTFMMGSPNDERSRDPDEGPVHEVEITRGFYIGKYEVTQAQYQLVLGNVPSTFRGGGNNNPVNFVKWHDAAEFCNRLSEIEGLQPVYTDSGNWEANLNANGYRLPTEAEWEYACRAGTTTRFSHGDAFECNDYCRSCELNQLYMWYCGHNNTNKTKEVGMKLPNPWGLHDMHGNLWEWCTDWYDSGYYLRSIQQDPVNKEPNQHRVLRGGYWDGSASGCRSASRSWFFPDSGFNPNFRNYPFNTFFNKGFRISRTP